MNSRKTNPVLLLIVIILLITNILMLFMFVFTPEKERKHKNGGSSQEGISGVLRDSVGFTENQVAAYLQLRSTERPKFKEFYRDMRRIKDKFYNLPYSPENDSLSLALADSIGIIQKNIDLNMRNYFFKIREICTVEQIPAFDSTISKVIRRMIGKPGDKPKTEKPKNQKTTEPKK